MNAKIATGKRNMVRDEPGPAAAAPARSLVDLLYDGFYQWQRTYGPLTASWKFGKNRYVALNSFELRQHRRSGWGMYTVNYGGGMTDVQMGWLDRELARSFALSPERVIEDWSPTTPAAIDGAGCFETRGLSSRSGASRRVSRRSPGVRIVWRP